MKKELDYISRRIEYLEGLDDLDVCWVEITHLRNILTYIIAHEETHKENRGMGRARVEFPRELQHNISVIGDIVYEDDSKIILKYIHPVYGESQTAFPPSRVTKLN